MMRNIKLTIAYDGGKYHGWQIQQNADTIQARLKEAIRRVTGETVVPVGCGRTDAGVHAYQYVCNFKTNSMIPADRFPYALNTALPNDIVCSGACETSENFHSNSDAVRKCYVYRILNRTFPDPFLNGRVWHYKTPLDIQAMKQAAGAFVGTHDFVGFASAGFTVKTTVRTIYSLDVEKTGDEITIRVTGNGFLYNMVRIIVGTLVFAGIGKYKPEDMEGIIASGDRKRAGITAPAEGLYLWGVEY